MRTPIRLLLCLITCVSCALAQDVETALKQYQGKVLILRVPYEGNSQHYDANGKALIKDLAGSWTVYGGVLIDRITPTPEKLSIQGRRALFLFHDNQIQAKEFKPIDRRGGPLLDSHMDLDISLASPVTSAEQVRAVLGKVFAFNTAELLDSVPELWRSCLKDRLIYDAKSKIEEELVWTKAPADLQPWPRGSVPPTSRELDIEDVFHIGNGTMNRTYGITLPEAVYTPDVPSIRIVGDEHIQGIVGASILVDSEGIVRRVRLIRPLGFGLDEAAFSELSLSRFRPATYDGKPIAVEMTVETSFSIGQTPASQPGSAGATANQSTKSAQPSTLTSQPSASSQAHAPSAAPASPKQETEVMSRSQLEDRLIHQYGKRVVALRVPVAENGQDFGADGTPTTDERPGSWLLYSGLLYVQHLKLKDDELDVTGPAVIHDPSYRFGGPVTIRVHLNHSLQSLAEAHEIMSRLFTDDKQHQQMASPEYRRAGESDEPVENVTKKPVPTYTPEPEMSLEARKAKYEGNVTLKMLINKNGAVSRVAVVRPLGMGLDAEAVKTIKTWRFVPAMRDGQPVACWMQTEVSFNLF